MPKKKADSEFEISPLKLKKGSKGLASQNLKRKVVHQKGQALVGIPKGIFDQLKKIMAGEIYVDWEEASNPFAAEIRIKFFSRSPAIDKMKDREGKSEGKDKPRNLQAHSRHHG